jgi:energy-coupling factor transporter ATP-binding protein EcfA2
MKLMTKLLLVHWHYFIHTTIEFDRINFLTGKNASGKSTIIDAMQVLLLGDTSGTFFNKAASGRSSRTLKGYLLGELGDDDEAGFKTLRNGRFTSFIVLEFFDDEKNGFFTAGCCFDMYSENEVQKMFFRFNGPMPENEFVVNRKPMDIALVRAFIREQYGQGGGFTTDTNQTFRQDLYGKLGGLQTRFGQLLKKAVSFDPNVDIQKFISEFVCDARETVNIEDLQGNIRSYTQLEEDEKRLREQLDRLAGIIAAWENYDRQRQNERLYSYLIDRAQRDIKTAAIENQERMAEKITLNINETKKAIEEEELRLESLRNQWDELKVQLAANKTAQFVEYLEKKIQEKEDEINGIEEEFENISRRFGEMVDLWTNRAEALSAGWNAAAGTVDPAVSLRITNAQDEARNLTAALKPVILADARSVAVLGEAKLSSLVKAADSIRTNAGVLLDRLEEEQDRLRNLRDGFRKEQASLEKGVYVFPRDALDLKEIVVGRLRNKTGRDVPVLIVAEAAEIPEPRWRNVIEAYLASQRFYLIVPPEHFAAARRVYDAVKHERRVYRTGIVDVEKIEKFNPKVEPGSLAEELSTENPWVRLFLNYALGRVMKCENVDELRRFRTALTSDGMLYQGFVLTAMDPERWARPAIGKEAVHRRLEEVKRELKRLEEGLSAADGFRDLVKPVRGISLPGAEDPARFVASAENVQRIPQLKEEIAGLRRDLDAVDRSAIAALEEHLASLDKGIKKLEQHSRDLRDQNATGKERLRRIEEEDLPKLKTELAEREEAMTRNYPAEWIESSGDPRYQKEMRERDNPAAIYQAFPRELTKSTNAKNEFWDELRELRRHYNENYKMGYDTAVPDNEAFDNAWLELSEIRLPEYRTKIEDARNKAYEQFREDFLSRLQSNIYDTKLRIDELNSALGRSSFGEDIYRFRIIPNPEYKRYYDMITDPMLLEGGYNLLSEQYNAKYKEEIRDLFSLITNEGEGRGDYEKRVQTFTDYRTYLSFDLEVINLAGESQRLSKTFGKKSGGETQTPFYIAVLASFAQLYRIGRDKKANTARIIIFDEAFSKMDSERIISSIRLLRQFNFQVILSAPFDKVADIGLLVDRNLCVIREDRQAMVCGFDPRKLESLEDIHAGG